MARSLRCRRDRRAIWLHGQWDQHRSASLAVPRWDRQAQLWRTDTAGGCFDPSAPMAGFNKVLSVQPGNLVVTSQETR